MARKVTDKRLIDRLSAASNENITGWRGLLMVLVIDKTWQLAPAVIVPIGVGLWLDSFFHTFPGLFIAGVVAAALITTRLALKVIKSAG